MEPATIELSDVTKYWTAGMAQMNQIAHSTALQACFLVIMEHVFLSAMSVITMMTAETGVTSSIAHIQLVEGTTSLVQVGAVSTKCGSVMERMTVRTTQMKKAVIMYQGNVSQANGPVHLGCVYPWITSVMGRCTVQKEKMRPTQQQAATAVFGDVPL